MRFNAERSRKVILRLLGRLRQATGAQRADLYDSLHHEVCKLDTDQVERLVERFNDEYYKYSALDRRRYLQTRATMIDYGAEPQGIQFGGYHTVYVPLANRTVDPEQSAIEACRRMLAKMLLVET
jgi:hypothetical protein